MNRRKFKAVRSKLALSKRHKSRLKKRRLDSIMKNCQLTFSTEKFVENSTDHSDSTESSDNEWTEGKKFCDLDSSLAGNYPSDNDSEGLKCIDHIRGDLDERSAVPEECLNSDTESEIDVSELKEKQFQAELAHWATSKNVNQETILALLPVLRRHGHSHLPKTAKTLLKTPKLTELFDIPPGNYIHFGLEKCLHLYLSTLPVAQIPTEINLLVNIDGIPIAKSSSSQFWPILGNLHNVKGAVPFVIGIYHGTQKPNDCNSFLQRFVREVVHLTTNGLKSRSSNIRFRLMGLICDAPARAYITGIKGHTGYYGCGKCMQRGKYINRRLCFPDQDATLRTDESFTKRFQEEHHIRYSIIEEIPGFGMVSGVPFEYMHLMCLGVMRKLINQWMRSKTHAVRLRSSKIDEASQYLESLKQYVCAEFPRKPRTMREIDRWKATEFRLVLLYIGPCVFKNILSEQFYEHFLCLHVAMRILASPHLCIELNDYAKALMKHFLDLFEILYGTEYMSYNVHGLLHLPDDVKKYGPVDNFSGFEFENQLQVIKNLLRKSDRPLQQIGNRLFEKHMASLPHMTEKTNVSTVDVAVPVRRHFDGPLLYGTKNPQYKTVRYKGLVHSSNIADHCCILKDGSIIVIQNIATYREELVIIGNKFLKVGNAFTIPCLSSKVGVFLASKLSDLKMWKLSSIVNKAIQIPKPNDNFLVLSLLHGQM